MVEKRREIIKEWIGSGRIEDINNELSIIFAVARL